MCRWSGADKGRATMSRRMQHPLPGIRQRLAIMKSNVMLLFRDGTSYGVIRRNSKFSLPHFVKIGVVDEHPFYLRVAKACSLNGCCLTEYRTQCLIERLFRADK